MNPTFLAQIMPKNESPAPATLLAPAPTSVNKALHATADYARDFADAGHQVIQSDTDPSSGADNDASGVESDARVFETDDNDDLSTRIAW